MKFTARKWVIVSLAILIAAFLIINLGGCSASIPANTSTSTVLVQNISPEAAKPATTQSSLNKIRVGDLPPEAVTTLQLIKNGGPFPFTKDGVIFNNYEGLLPKKAAGYYHEYTVVTPGSPDRGARRIIAGENKEYFYTDDHYSTFKLILE